MPVVAIPTIVKATSIGKSVFKFANNIFGGAKTVPEKFSIPQDLFDQRFTRGATFRKLWRRNYFLEDGASEIPPGKTIEDVHEDLFGVRISQAERNANLYSHGLGRGTLLNQATPPTQITTDQKVGGLNTSKLVTAGFDIKNVGIFLFAGLLIFTIGRKL